ncbi:MAG TPA: Trm112 family protein [Segetibacter sp.]|nr:Trm112 family protein [Segetibacter sp.]
MRQSLMNKLCCPFDKQDLELKVFAQETSGNITEGMLTCNHCKRYYPIVYGVPIMSPDEYREPLLEAPLIKKWENKLEGTYLKDFRLIE